MIVIEDRFEEMIDVLPEMFNKKVSEDLPFKVKYSFGDDKELNSYLLSLKGDAYPLIWMVYPLLEVHTLKKVKVEDLSFILAVKTNDIYLNKQRFATNYKNVLVPLYNNFTELLERANIVNLNEKIRVVKYPHYSNEELPTGDEKLKSSEKNKTIDIWDALKVTISCTITDSFFRRDIKFIKNILNNQ